MAQIPKTQVDQLQGFVHLLKANPDILHDPSLFFFREYLESLGASIPDAPKKKSGKEQKDPSEQENVCPSQSEEPAKEGDNTVEGEVESDIELDMVGVIEPDNEPAQEMGNCDKNTNEDLNDEQLDKFNEKRSEAMHAFSEREWERAIELFTECVKIDSTSSQVYTKRGTAYLKLNRPNACIRDCDRAITLNPDSAAAHKFRGRAHRLLGHFVEAAKDLRTACKLDFDEVADEWLKEVTPNAKKIEEHERKKQRKQQEREINEKKEKIKKAKEAREKAANESKFNEKDGPEGMEGLGGMFQDPDVLAALQDPEIAAAFQDISQNPANMSKYQSNPKIMDVVMKMMGKFGGGKAPMGMPGMGGAFPGGMSGMFPGGFPSGENVSNGKSKPSHPSSTTDDLD